jgi:uncharacterized damage-inducible protein DinB
MNTKILQQHLIWALQHGFDPGKGHEAKSLLDAIQDLTPEQAAWVSSTGSPSIWIVVNHVACWKETVARTIEGEKISFEGKWPAPQVISQAEWDKDVQTLNRWQTRLLGHLDKFDDARLNRPLPDLEDWSLAKVFMGLVAHDCYHCGQITKMRQLQGISQ